uniref:SAM domain-containing protein n=1 Tax=Ciona intestinalis TaxID=7719 RepID=F6XKA8_CIOIN
RVMYIHEWGCEEVKVWLKSEGFEKYSELLCEKHEVDGDVLLSLTEKDLRNPPLQFKKLSDIKKLWRCLKLLQQKSKIERRVLNVNITNKEFPTIGVVNLQTPGCSWHANRYLPHSVKLLRFNLESDQYKMANSCPKHEYLSVDLLHNLSLFVSFLYATFVSWVTAYMMVLVHERVPDKQKYPPLPDIFLDNVPLIPYAFQLAELCGLSLAIVWLFILFFHKHRMILLRRFFSIASSVFLLRSVTIIVTSLSVPGQHLQCSVTAMYHSAWQRFVRATEIVAGFGMTLTGVHTCGDYMFSGHTAYLTLFNHLITEYTPSKYYRLHTFSWVLNLFGIFFVLAAHEHYSIDVVIAFYITSRIFLYYHMLANTRCYWYSKRVKIWFPLLSYFECNVPGKIPNEYCWPVTRSDVKRWIQPLYKKNK